MGEPGPVRRGGSRLAPHGPRNRPPPRNLDLLLAFLLASSGCLEVFAGYAESIALLLATTLVWVSQMVRPLRSGRDVAWLLFAWCLMVASHRMALLTFPGLVARGWLDRSESDVALHRWWLVVAVGAAVAIATSLPASGRLSSDVSELAIALGADDRSLISIRDLLNLLVIVAPLIYFAPLALLSPRTAGSMPRRPLWAWLSCIGLLPLVLVFPMAPSGLGAHRDWDLAALFGTLLTIAVVTSIARLRPAAMATFVRGALPGVLLIAMTWVAVNADSRASISRAIALAFDPRALPVPQRSHLFAFLGGDALEAGQPDLSAQWFSEAFRLNPNPRDALQSAHGWIRAGDYVKARVMLTRARERGLSGRLVEGFASLDSMLVADSAAAMRSGP